jgi:hypothetical protein
MQTISLTSQQETESADWIKHFEEKYLFQFFNPTYVEVPYASELFDDAQIKKRISGLEYFLLASRPIDMGTNDHLKMHRIRDAFSKDEYFWHKKHNKLGINCWGTKATTGLVLLNQLLNRNDLHLCPFPNTKNYDKLSFSQKLEICNFVDGEFYKILEKLYKEYANV